jgi:hypothetical protein
MSESVSDLRIVCCMEKDEEDVGEGTERLEFPFGFPQKQKELFAVRHNDENNLKKTNQSVFVCSATVN